MMKNKPLKKQSTTPPDTKTQNYFLEIRERTAPNPLLLKLAAVSSTRRQRYTETNDYQMPTNKYNKHWQMK